MKQSGCVPDVVNYNALINYFCKFDKMPIAFQFFSQMKHNGVIPSVVTYSTLIDALSNDGMMQHAINFFY
ncbi:Putative pentatricopeptide repeat-containing protein At2g02150 [Linum grandiflorum]